MVHRTEDWAAFRDHTERCRRGYYQLKSVPEGVELKIMAGNLCLERGFEPDDKRSETQKDIFAEMLGFCKTQGWIRIEESISEHFFFV